VVLSQCSIRPSCKLMASALQVRFLHFPRLRLHHLLPHLRHPQHRMPVQASAARILVVPLTHVLALTASARCLAQRNAYRIVVPLGVLTAAQPQQCQHLRLPQYRPQCQSLCQCLRHRRRQPMQRAAGATGATLAAAIPGAAAVVSATRIGASLARTLRTVQGLLCPRQGPAHLPRRCLPAADPGLRSAQHAPAAQTLACRAPPTPPSGSAGTA